MGHKVDIMFNNLYKDCTIEELHDLWNGYKKAEYEVGFYKNDNPMTKYKNKYVELYGVYGVILSENDLLRAIAYKVFENNIDNI